MRKCYFGNAPVLAIVTQAYGCKTSMTWLEIQINDLSEFAGCKGKLTQAQITETAAIMLDKYGYYKLTEFMLYFQKVKRGEYGSFYGAVDPMRLLEAIKMFNDERAWEYDREESRRRKAERQKAQAESDNIVRRYQQHVPGADSGKGIISLLQFRLMGFASLPDKELDACMADIAQGRKTIPKDVNEILEFLKTNYGIAE